ncbi:MAG TPA: O-antigen polymerase [Bacteroidales bacterium]|nr:O-antigen polymerase [Bacteroidales bacterium]
MNRYKLIVYFLTIINLILSLIIDNILFIAELNLLYLVIIIVLDYNNKRSISFLQTWILAFIFIIISEAILIDQNTDELLKATQYLIAANTMIILGYFYPNKHRNISSESTVTKVRMLKLTPYMLYALVVFYVLYSLPGALLSYSYGRDAAAADRDVNLLLSGFANALGFILPSIIAFYHKEIKYRKSIIIPLIISLPIFAILFIGGTRFPLLFSFGGFLFVSHADNKGRITLNAKFIGLILILVISSSIMGQFRYGGIKSYSFRQSNFNFDERFSRLLASNMSPEGVVDMTALSMTYFESHPHTYGKSIAFLTYFWIPRQIWPDKPTMLGHWLIREYRSGFGAGHSASFGFVGELYADFGYFSLIFIYFLGILLQRADRFREKQLEHASAYSKIMIGMMFSYVFFFVRSPVTATINFIGILIVYYMFRRILFKKVVV